MKKGLMSFSLGILLVSSVLAQEETLMGGELSHGGFGGPVLKITQINEELGLLTGGRGAWIVGHMITIGGGGYTLINDIEVTSVADAPNLRFEYGGFEMGFIIASDKLLHFSVNSLFGTGTVGHRWGEGDGDWDAADTDHFFVLEPSANVIVNVAKFFRIGLGASYRYVTGVDDFGDISDADLSGVSAVVTLKFGSF
ncbi:MAG: hypothetical protein JSW54_10805 [Fidelibacterota bacterium]|nr:MAG: hypothetical protein JSW54_10805 [Candidatus Neomarinimicrobiota bacterium]